jgi:hypothetical protein
VRPTALRQLCAHALAVVFSASTWFYIEHILKPQQIAYDIAHQRPRGNFSDLYPRWLGARELLLHQRNPYSSEITQEIQQGYYGRPLDPTRPDDPKDQQAFAYPVYVVFLLWPTIHTPFEEVQSILRCLLPGLIVASVLLWIRTLHWRLPITWKLTVVVLMLGWLPTVQGLKLQQLSLLVFALLTGCACLLQAGLYLGAGALLALATIKPQLAWPLVAWLILWAAAEWRARWRLFLGFVLTMILLLVGSELVLPGWSRMFLDAIRQYREYTSTESVSITLFGAVVGRMFEIACVLACAACLWARRKDASAEGLVRAIGVVMALTVLLIPKTAPYNQVLLVPSVLMLIQSDISRKALPAIRMANRVGGLLLVWPWIATMVLSVACFFAAQESLLKFWQVPFFTNLMVPVTLFGLALLDMWMSDLDPNHMDQTHRSPNHSHILRDGSVAG